MSKITRVIQFSSQFDIDPSTLDQLGVLDPTLNVDTPLFIDPLLLSSSRHKEISKGAHGTYENFFRQIIKLLRASKVRGDVAWRAAERMLRFPEVRGTCLGYGASSVSGSIY